MARNEYVITINAREVRIGGPTATTLEEVGRTYDNYRTALDGYKSAVPALLEYSPQASHSLDQPTATLEASHLFFDDIGVILKGVAIIVAGLRTSHFLPAFLRSVDSLQSQLSTSRDVKGPSQDVADITTKLRTASHDISTLDEDSIVPWGTEGSAFPINRIASLYDPTRPFNQQSQLIDALDSVILGQKDIASLLLLHIFSQTPITPKEIPEAPKAQQALRAYLYEYFVLATNKVAGLPITKQEHTNFHLEMLDSHILQILLAGYSLVGLYQTLLLSNYRAYLQTIFDLPEEAIGIFEKQLTQMSGKQASLDHLYSSYINDDLETPFALAEKSSKAEKTDFCKTIAGQGALPEGSPQFATLIRNAKSIYHFFQVPEHVERIHFAQGTIASIDVAVTGDDEPGHTFNPQFINLLVKRRGTNVVLAIQIQSDGTVFGIPSDFEGDVHFLLEQLCGPVVDHFKDLGIIQQQKKTTPLPQPSPMRQPDGKPVVYGVDRGLREQPQLVRVRRPRQSEIQARETALQPPARVVHISIGDEFRRELGDNKELRRELGDILRNVEQEIRENGFSQLLTDVKSAGGRYQTVRIGAGGAKRDTRLSLAVVRSAINPNEVDIVVLGIAPRGIAYDEQVVNEMIARLDTFLASLPSK